MSKYDYEKLGRRTYENYVEVMTKANDNLPIPTKEEYEAEVDASIDRGIMVFKAREMLTSLQSILMEDIDLLMEVYDVVAPIMNLMGTEKATEEYLHGRMKVTLNGLVNGRRMFNKEYKETHDPELEPVIADYTRKIKAIREELKGGNTHA